MFVDYSFYTDVFKGAALTEDEFNKFGNLACMYISSNTLSRISDNKISSYPVELQNSAKMCACAMAEYLKQVDDVQKSITGNVGGNSSEGIVRSKSAGAVSVSYDTSLTAQYFLDQQRQEDMKQSILRLYLSPICINGVMYNLLSKVLSENKAKRPINLCPHCNI